MSLPTGPRHGTDAAERRQTIAFWANCGNPTILRRVPAVTSLSITLSAALGALVVVLAVLLPVLLRRSSRRADREVSERVAEVVETLEQRMDELATELAGAVARAEEESRRSRFLGEIAGSIDLDEVVTRTLDAALAVTSGDAALLFLEPRSEGEAPGVGVALAPDGADPIAGPPDGSRAAAINVSYSY